MGVERDLHDKVDEDRAELRGGIWALGWESCVPRTRLGREAHKSAANRAKPMIERCEKPAPMAWGFIGQPQLVFCF